MLRPFQYKHIIWDWNGTLLDDGWLFVDVMNAILKRRDMNTITLEKYREIFGFPVKDYYIKLGFDLEKESFEDPIIAKQMNDNFVNIKVDREERPDIALYIWMPSRP